MAIIVLFIAAGASLLRGGRCMRYVYDEHAAGQTPPQGAPPAAQNAPR